MEFKLFEDTILNSNEKILKKIISRIEKNDGYCPCYQEGVEKEDTKCPCKHYTDTHDCHCTLYLKKD